jgi:hypothetical protein
MDWGALLQALRPRRRLMSFLAMLAIANIVAAQTAEADVGGAMNSFFNGMGGAANASGPVAYQGQASGYYSGGNIWVRTPDEQLSLGSLQLPRSRRAAAASISSPAASPSSTPTSSSPRPRRPPMAR